MRGVKIFAAACLFIAAFASSLHAQELKVQPTPFTAWLDFQAGALARQGRAFPIWLERVETHAQKFATGQVEKTTFRLRFRRFAGLNNELLLRLYFDDTQKPVVSAWSETGGRAFDPKELGQGLGLPTSETLTIAMSDVDYVDIETTGDGSNIRGALLSSLQKAETRHALDFNPAPPLSDPFHNPSTAAPGVDDALLFGRLKATLDSGTLTLSAENEGRGIFEFELATPPLLAVVTFEILNADVTAPPEISANDRALGAATIILPDLADPAYAGSIEPLKAEAIFHYGGWLKCQKLVPASALRSGLNSLQFTADTRSGAVAIRAVEVQLKYSTNANAQ